MAKILVSDLCELSPAAAHRRVFRCREERGPLVHLFLDRFRLFFSLFLIVSCRLLFSRDYKGLYCIFADFRPVNRLYFLATKMWSAPLV
jgi:hypothetical protein